MTQAAFMALVAGSALIDAAVAVVVLRAAGRGDDGSWRLTFWGIVPAVLVTGVVFGIKLPVLMGLGLNSFGAMHITYIDLVIVIPLVALGLLTAERMSRRRRGRIRLTATVRTIAALAVVIAPAAGVYATFIEVRRLRLETATIIVPEARDGHQPLRIGVLADIQTNAVTEYERDAVARLLAEHPDLILVPGDLFQGFPSQFRRALPELQELLGSLHAPGGVFFVLGDCEDAARAHALLDGTGIRILENEIVRTCIADREVIIGGIELDYTTPEARKIMNELESLPDEGDVRILLSHRPDSVLALPPDGRIDLVVAGHTHGGQVQVPGLGPPLTLSRVPRDVAAGGLHSIEGNRIYVSRGLGRERGQAPSIRFLCPPEITLLTVRE